MIKKFTLVIIANFLFCTVCFSQNDTIKKDSVSLYYDIHKYSQKGKFSKFIYKLFFRSSKLNQSNEKNNDTEKNISYENLNGKTIRKIIIKTYDPFGHSIEDSNKIPKERIENFGNAMHIKTKNFTIKNLLLFKKNDPFDYLSSKESERLIRSQRYIRRVKIEPKLLENNLDSIDVIVNVLDSWSLLPNGSLSSSSGKMSLTERNLLGLGHQINGNYKERFADKSNTVSGGYSIANIKDSYIRFNAAYENDFDNNSRRILSLNRNFFSPLTKWAGGIYFENKLQNEQFTTLNDTVISAIKSEFHDYWLGKSYKLFTENDYDSRTTRLITAITYNRTNYLEKPSLEIDPTSFFSNQKNVIVQIGITSQKFYKDSYIFNYDIVEDVPYGEIAALTVGYQNKNEKDNLYLGGKLSYGRNYSFGYLSSTAELGSFFNKGITFQSALKLELNYFSPLFLIGKWKTRQFIKPYFLWGNNRDSSEKDLLTLSDINGIQGFSDQLKGTQKWVVSFQTQTYAPNGWKGFRFSPYLNLTLGSLSNTSQNILASKVYSKIGVGILINNDYLIFNSFQISFSYYPTIPFEGKDIIKTNSFENDDLSIPEFQISKPYYIKYQ